MVLIPPFKLMTKKLHPSMWLSNINVLMCSIVFNVSPLSSSCGSSPLIQLVPRTAIIEEELTTDLEACSVVSPRLRILENTIVKEGPLEVMHGNDWITYHVTVSRNRIICTTEKVRRVHGLKSPNLCALTGFLPSRASPNRVSKSC